MNVKNISGAQSLIIIFIFTSLLTRFDFPFSLFFIFSIVYSILYLLPKLLDVNGWKKQSYILVLHYLILVYLATILLVHKLLDLNFNSFPHFWEAKSTLAFMSIIFVNIVVLKTSENNIIKTLEFFKKISYFIIIESIIFFILPSSIGIFQSDFEAGYRFTSTLTPGYIMTGFFLILGYTSYLHLNLSKSKYKIFFIFLLFCFALIQTKDRTSILTFLAINFFVLYKSASSKILIYGVFKKFSFLLKVALMLSIVFFSMQHFGERKDFMSFSSVLDRYVLLIRGVNVAKETLPFGGGPGSQIRLMFSDKIPFNQRIDIVGNFKEVKYKSRASISLKEDFNYSKEYLRKRVGSGKTMSPHNTYMDFTISLGLLGILIVISILLFQCKSLIRLTINQDSHNYYIYAMFVSSFVLLMNSSLITSIWLFIIMYKVLQVSKVQVKL